MKKVHLDTDLGGDIDDICALSMLLKMTDIQITGITVGGDTKGKRTGYVKEVLRVADKAEIPVKAGAENSLKYYRYDLALPEEEKYWSKPVPASPNKVEEALDLIKKSIEENAIIICIGPLTNLYLFDLKYPGFLKKATIFIMGGHIYPLRTGYPKWINKDDFNIQIDVKSSNHVLKNCNPTLIPITVTAETYLRRSSLEIIRKSGILGSLIAKQMQAFEEDEKMDERFGKKCANLPDDMINFQHDPLTCAIALGWKKGIEIKKIPLIIEEKDGQLYERIDKTGKTFKIVTKIDAKAFEKYWLNIIINRK